MSSINIEQLIEQCKQNNQLAQMNVYRLYAKAMYNISFRIVHDSGLAEDLVQESFLTAFNDINKLEHAKAFGSWLKRMVVFKSINAVKKEQRHHFTELDDVSYKLTENEDEDNMSFLTDLKIKDVYDCIKQLKENY